MPYLMSDPNDYDGDTHFEPHEIEAALRDGYYFARSTTYSLHHKVYRLRVIGVSHLKARDAILNHGWHFGGNPYEMLHTIKVYEMPNMPTKGSRTLTWAELKLQLPPATKRGVGVESMSVVLISADGLTTRRCSSHNEVVTLLSKGWRFNAQTAYIHHPTRLVHCTNCSRGKALKAILEHGWRWGTSESATRRILASQVTFKPSAFDLPPPPPELLPPSH